jgi:hypothetical protein
MLGNYGEFLGSVAVLATLIYLAAQIRQNSELAKAHLETDVMQAFTGVHQFPSQHPEVIAKLRASVELNDVETVLWENLQLNLLYACAIGFQASKFADPERTQRFVLSATMALRFTGVLLEEHELNLRAAGYDDFIDNVKFELAK